MVWRFAVRSARASQRSYTDLHKDLLNLKYKPNALGSVDYFRTAKEIQASVSDLGNGNSISDGHIMSIAETAFTNSGHDKNSIAKVRPAPTIVFDTVFGQAVRINTVFRIRIRTPDVFVAS